MAALPKARKTFSVRLTYFFYQIFEHFHLRAVPAYYYLFSAPPGVWGLG